MLAVLMLLALQDPDTLVRRLGDESIEARERATIELRALGVRASDALIRASAHSDAEVSARAGALLVVLLDHLPSERVDRVPALVAERDRRRFESAFAQVVAIHGSEPPARASLLALKPWADLAALGRGIVPRLIAKLETGHAYHATLALGLFDDPRAARALDAEAERDRSVAHGDPST